MLMYRASIASRGKIGQDLSKKWAKALWHFVFQDDACSYRAQLTMYKIDVENNKITKSNQNWPYINDLSIKPVGRLDNCQA